MLTAVLALGLLLAGALAFGDRLGLPASALGFAGLAALRTTPTARTGAEGWLTSALEPAAPGTGPQPELSIEGSVEDDTGRLLPGIRVGARRVDRELSPQPQDPLEDQVQLSDGLGRFKFVGLAPGMYEITASGGESYLSARIRVQAGVASAELRLLRLKNVRIAIADGTANHNQILTQGRAP